MKYIPPRIKCLTWHWIIAHPSKCISNNLEKMDLSYISLSVFLSVLLLNLYIQVMEQAVENWSLTTDMSCPRGVTSSVRSYTVSLDKTGALFLFLVGVLLQWFTCVAGICTAFTTDKLKAAHCLLCHSAQDASSWQIILTAGVWLLWDPSLISL